MHTIMVLAGGFLLLGLFLAGGQRAGGGPALAVAVRFFLPTWFVFSLVNLWLGTRAGYTVSEELPMFCIVFGVPALAALFFARRFKARG